MQEKKRPEKNKTLPELRSSVGEILVANGRVFQPFIRTFEYTGENITKAGLGTLIGVFEIDDQSEDSAYIVNFLASVAKKEYFNNPRRGAIESFEAALHKINLALAELVKHGNIAWLGKFHGALGVLEKNNLHFSVSGHATILLLRNQTIADISEGLASDEAHIHPIKTFVEVSSGRLSAGDQILMSSPELLALFSLEELNKHATRMDGERFTQFLKTALVNELDMAGLMVVDVTENLTPKSENRSEKKNEDPAPVRVNNVFSQSAFDSKKRSETPSIEAVLIEQQSAKEEEYIDNKTGHIYVQGDTPQAPTAHPFFDAMHLKSEEWLRATRVFLAAQGKNLRRGKKHAGLMLGSLHEKSAQIGRRMGRAMRRQWRKYEEHQTNKAALAKTQAATLPPDISPLEKPVVSDIPRPPITTAAAPKEISLHEEMPSETTGEELGVIPEQRSSRLARFYQRQETSLVPTETPITPSPTPMMSRENNTRIPNKDALVAKMRTLLPILQSYLAHCATWLTKGSSSFSFTNYRTTLLQALSRSSRSLRTSLFRSLSRYQTLPKNIRLVIPLALICLLLLTLYLFRTPSPQTASETETASPVDTFETRSTDTPADKAFVFVTDAPNIVTSVVLNDESYIVTTDTVRSLTTNTSFPLPSGTEAKFAAAMDDLRLIFVFTTSQKLYAFSPISKTFVENTLPFDGALAITGIDTYLTYLYVLDSATDQVYRFPRADGGFGAGTAWLKESIAIEETSRLAVNETLFIAPDTTTLKGFFRGRASNTFELPSELRITDLYTHPGLQYVYALDSEHSRLLIWNQEGKLVQELSHEKFSQGRTLSVNEKNGTVYLGTTDSLLSYPLP